MKILVIEDDPSIRELLAEFLQAEGHYVKCLSDVPCGPEHSPAENFGIAEFDRVILDLTLPSGRAWEWADEARKALPSWNFVITTAATANEVKVRIGEFGCRFLPKPFSAETLFEAIR